MFRTSKEKHWKVFKRVMRDQRVYNFVMVNESVFNEATHIDTKVFNSHGHVTVFKKAHMYCYHIETMTLRYYNDWLASKMDNDIGNLFDQILGDIFKSPWIHIDVRTNLKSEEVPDENEDDELLKWKIDQWAKTGELR